MPDALTTVSPHGPTLETKRLILRPPVKGDFEGFCAFHADAQAMTHLGGVQTPPLVWRAMRSVIGAWAADGFSMFSVIEKSSGEWIGRIGPIYPFGWPGHEVGWGLLTRFQGKGYALEASAATMDFAFETLGWERVIHTIAPTNEASVKIARRLGSVNQGPGQLPDPFADVAIDIWGQSRAEWLSNRRKL